MESGLPMMPGDVVLVGIGLIAALFFIGGLIDVYRDSRAATRRRKRRRVTIAPADLEKEPVASVSPTLAPPTGEPISAPEPRAVVPPPAAEVSWPAGRPAPASPLRPPAPSGNSESDAGGESDGAVDLEPFLAEELEHGRMVVHYANGQVIKGFSYDFYPNKPVFHLLPPVAGFSFTDEAVPVRIKDLKAVFFVRDFVGDPSYNERKWFAEGERQPGRKMEVKFPDGEVLVGTTMGYDRHRPGFFLIPADPKSNNLKVFVVSRAAIHVRFL